VAGPCSEQLAGVLGRRWNSAWNTGSQGTVTTINMHNPYLTFITYVQNYIDKTH